MSYFVAARDKGAAMDFMQDCAARIIGRPQITTDALRSYPDAIEAAFGVCRLIRVFDLLHIQS